MIFDWLRIEIDVARWLKENKRKIFIHLIEIFKKRKEFSMASALAVLNTCAVPLLAGRFI